MGKKAQEQKHEAKGKNILAKSCMEQGYNLG
jgi:hypothetical protein